MIPPSLYLTVLIYLLIPSTVFAYYQFEKDTILLRFEDSVSPASDRKSTTRAWNTGRITSVSVSVVLSILILVFFFVFYCCRKAKENESRQWRHLTDDIVIKMKPVVTYCWDSETKQELVFMDKNVPMFNLDDLLRASAQLLGRGNLGTTYKATLESGVVVAIKRLHKNMITARNKSFVQTMQSIGNTRHNNLSHLLSFYYSKEDKLIVSEFMPDGNLFNLLHEQREGGRVALKWEIRLSIIKDIAKGLEYIHEVLPNKVAHANLKSSNVLISRDSNTYHSKLTDYGFLTLLRSPETLEVAKSPEFKKGKKLTDKADVYSFGIVVLEIITGRIPGGQNHEDLSEWVRNVVDSDWSTDILDVQLQDETEGHDDLLKLTDLALECTDTRPEKRPKMSEVVVRIQKIVDRHERKNVLSLDSNEIES